MRLARFFAYLLIFTPISLFSQAIKPNVITIQPIVVLDNEGNDPASFNIPLQKVNGVFENTNIDLYFLEPIYYSNIKARDGMINLDSIVKLAYKDGIIRGDGDIANLIFVNAVDGKKGPLGRGMMNGNISFIALGSKNSGKKKNMQAFVITHELCHNLGLNHVVDDENIPNDPPNIMGDGRFSKRIDPKNSLTAYQISEIKKSPLVRPRIELLSVGDGRKAILDESFEPFFSKLQKTETAAFTAQEIYTDNLDEIRNFARLKFEEAVIDFNSDEKEALQFIVKEVNKVLIENKLYKFASHPWRIIKTEKWLCGGFAYTRGNFIVLSEMHTNFITEHYKPNMTNEEIQILMERIGALLVHEQTHCLQRTFPSQFEELYADYWDFIKVKFKDYPDIRELQVSNPDAPIANWVYPAKRNEYYWIRTLFKEKKALPIMGKDFTEHVYLVEKKDDRFLLKKGRAGSPLFKDLSDIKSYTESFPVTRGIDHPNEISAYMFADVFKSLLQDKEAFKNINRKAKNNTKQFNKWYSKNF